MLERITETQGLIIEKAALVDLDLSMLFMLGLFLLLFLILNKTFAQPMLKVFDQRHDLTDGAREAAASAVKRAEERMTTYETKLSETRREAVANQKQLRQEGIAREHEMLDGVRKETETSVSLGLAELQAAQKVAEVTLETTSRDLGERIVKRVLGGVA